MKSETVTKKEARILRSALVTIRELAALHEDQFANTVWAICEKAINDESAQNLVEAQRRRMEHHA